MKLFATLLISIVFCIGALPKGHALTVEEEEEEYDFWFTGTIQSPTPQVISVGHVNVEPFVFAANNSAIYGDDWQPDIIPSIFSLVMPLDIQFGIFEHSDLEIIPQFSYKKTQGQSAVEFNDFFVGWSYQIVDANDEPWIPAVKFTLAEIFPTGNYQNLDPKKLGTDNSGAGSFITQAFFVISKLFHLQGPHFLQVYFTPIYGYAAPVHVEGFNAYGGGFGTDGTAYPGNSFEGIISFEYSITHNWVLGLDAQFLYQNKIRFKGKRGVLFITPTEGLPPVAIPAPIGAPSALQFTLAPCLEYNFSASMGIVGGCWFTIAGQNALQFTSGAIAFNYYH